MSANIVRVDFSNEATLFEAEKGGRLRRWLRHVLRQLRLIPPRRAYNLFQRNMGAYRFVMDDGQVCIVPVSMELVEDAACDAEAIAREMALNNPPAFLL